MVWFIIGHLFTTLLAWVQIGRLSEQEKDLEILLLRQQLDIVERRLDKPVRLSKVEKLTVAVLAAKLKATTKQSTARLRAVICLFQPDKVLKWHRELVRRQWTHHQPDRGGRPRTSVAVETLIVRFVRENPDWGYGKLEGELHKLGYTVSQQTIADILDRHGIPPAPQRKPSVSWRHLMQHYKAQLLACDLFTVDTLFLQTVYVLFFIELQTRRVYLAGCTSHPDAEWVTQQARQMVWQLEDHNPAIHFLIHDRDTKCVTAFDTVFRSTHVHIIRTPFRAPNANAYAERWVRTVRHECLNTLIIVNQAHLRHVLSEFVSYYNLLRPHQGLDQQRPIPSPTPTVVGNVCSRPILGGIIYDHYRAA
ncbi:MAG: integrase core domain-containing protein [Aggregatilineales bacterium]